MAFDLSAMHAVDVSSHTNQIHDYVLGSVIVFFLQIQHYNCDRLWNIVG